MTLLFENLPRTPRDDIAATGLLFGMAFVYGAPAMFLCGSFIVGIAALESMIDALNEWDKEEAAEQTKWAERIQEERTAVVAKPVKKEVS